MRRLLLPLAACLICTRVLATPLTYISDPAKSRLEFSFTQAGAQTTGRFQRFTATLRFDPADLPASQLSVKVALGSVSTQDANRDDGLRSDDFFKSSIFPEATFVSSVIAADGEGGYRATGKLTIRNVTREVAVPFTFTSAMDAGKPNAAMKGQLILQRLDYGVGQGEWKSTRSLANSVPVRFDLSMHAG